MSDTANSSNSTEAVVLAASENIIPQVSSELLKTEIQCETRDGDKIPVRVGLLYQSKTFANMWKDLSMSSATEEQLKEFVFPVKAVSSKVFKKVVEWLQEHVGKPEPVAEEDPATRERKWFSLNDYEKKFFEVDVEELAELLVAGNFLDIPSLYLFGCQSMAAMIKDKSPEEIRAMFGLEDDLTEEEKSEIRRKNVWCNY